MLCRLVGTCVCLFSLVAFAGCNGSGGGSDEKASSSSQTASVGNSSDSDNEEGSGSDQSDTASSGTSEPSNQNASSSDDQTSPDQANSSDSSDNDPIPEQTIRPSDGGGSTNVDEDDGASDVADGSSEDDASWSNGDDTNLGVGEAGNENDDDSAVSDGEPAPSEYITDVVIHNQGQAATGVENVSFGQVFADGDVARAQHVVAVIDGSTVPTQVDRKATWSSGSLRHAVITIQAPALTSGGSQRVQLYAVGRASNSGFKTLTINDLLGTNFSAEVRVRQNGTTYTADARRALERVAQLGSCSAWGQASCKRWLAGGLASEWIVPATLTTGNADTPRLRVYFNVRAYRGTSGGIANVRVDSVIENDLTYAIKPNNVSYSAHIAVGDNQYSVDGLTHYSQTRWHHVLWTRSAPELYVEPSVKYLQSTGAISNYADLSPSEDFLDSVRQQVMPMHHGDQTPDMGATGAQAGIGPLPRWTSTFVVSGDRRAFNWMLANDDAVGSYSFHYRDSHSGRPVTIVDYPYITIAGLNWARRAGGSYERDLLPSCETTCSNPNHFDMAHHPSIGYVPYLVTGDFYYLEELQFTASYIELWANPGYRNTDKGRLLRAYQQVRSQAWNLRSISDAAFATPDDDPMKSYFVNQIDYIVQDYLANYVDDTGHELHTLDGFGAIHYASGSSADTSIPPWQADFFTWAAGHAAEQDVPGAQRLRDWLSVFHIGLMTSAEDGDKNGFCWVAASAYKLKVRDEKDSPIYTTLSEVYENSFPRLNGLECASQAMANQLSASDDPLSAGEMKGYPHSPTGFPSNLQIALAVSADTDLPDGHKAWRVFEKRKTKPDYSDYPNFAVVPRSVR
ncbi:hypothetical protein V5738_05670 [Salinisphaera sp. SPP-AMP-43]|uniref:hypothetical protein n=1 Tax=Salinisphaera sp. SPP-AMP-43 TaxID=3121288 RepID=UPI003C6E0DCA